MSGLLKAILMTPSGGGIGVAGNLRYEYYNSGDDGNFGFYSTYYPAQTFTVGATGHKITSVKLLMYRVGTPGPLTVGIRATDVNGHPVAPDLTIGTIEHTDDFTTDTAGLWYEITLTEYTLLANTKYAIVCRNPESSAPQNSIYWRWDSTPSYGGGNVEISSNSGSSWAAYNFDFMFEVWGKP